MTLLSIAVGKIIVFYAFTVISISAFAQVGGKASFEFLTVPNNARLAALGGVNVSLADRDINFIYTNPALVSDTLTGWASASYQSYVANINHTTVNYLNKFGKVGLLGIGIQYVSYGTIKSYDATGAEVGTFNSGETAIVVGKSHHVNNFRFGVNTKMVFSSIAGYRSSAIMFDVGVIFVHPHKKITVGMAMKNPGLVLSRYSTSDKPKLPIDVQLGITFKPEHMPFQFSITGYNLIKSNITYYDVQNGIEKGGVFDRVLRRFNFATEVLIHRNVNLMIGYNYRIHQELKLANGGGGAGLSFGFSAKVKAAEFVFSRGGYVAGKAGYTFTLAINTRRLLRR